MKKYFIIALSALALLSCSKSYKAQDIEMLCANDSVNYVLGYLNGLQIRTYQVSDSTKIDAAVTEFIDALQRGWDGDVAEETQEESVAKNIGRAIKKAEDKGLADNAKWAINEKIFFQGFVNGLYSENTIMDSQFAQEFFRSSYQASMMDSTEYDAKVVTAKCGTKPSADVKLKNFIDSINYAFGFLNGNEIGMYVLAADTTGEDKLAFINNMNKAMKDNCQFPELIASGEQIGKTIKEQSAQGLIGVEALTTDFELIKQGFINGLYKHDEMTLQEANQYITEAIRNIGKQEGEKFLEENAKRPEVHVTESGLQYEVLIEGEGPKPGETDKVKVNYEGKLVSGKVFDSSYERGEPISFALNQVIKGWTEGLQLMSVGSKYMLYIPYQLGYGEQGSYSIPACATLIFTVELLDIEKGE